MKKETRKRINILLTSVGRRSYLVKFFKAVLGTEGEVHVSNSSSFSPAFIFADKSVVTPLIHDNNYIPFLLEYCRENEINAVIPLFDVDLPVLAAHKTYFSQIGVEVIVSSERVISICNDKWRTYNFLIDGGFNAAKTYLSKELALRDLNNADIRFPLVVKPRWGMGSIGVFRVDNREELEVLYNRVVSYVEESYLKYESKMDLSQCVIIQEQLEGQEYGLDVINNLRAEYQTTIVKRKYAMRSGETDCAEVVAYPELKSLGRSISNKLGHVANLDMDVFVDGDKLYVLEMNARFGGGYPFSHMAGVNLPLAMVKWLRKENVDLSVLTERIGVLGHKDIEMVEITK